ncbi:hypothetical protein SP41_43 [Salmonella phage 41]|nr:hypothetical protein SP41_43 [Salmonella phage 41]
MNHGNTPEIDNATGLKHTRIKTRTLSIRQRLNIAKNQYHWADNWYSRCKTFGVPYRAYLSKKVMKTILDQ